MPNIKVRLTEETEAQQAGDASGALQKASKGDAKKMASTSLFAHAAVSNVKQAVKYSLGNVGNFTGDYVLQNQIDVGLQVFEDVAAIGFATAAGGLPGAIIATASIGIKYATKEISRQNQMAVDRAQFRYDYARSGNALFDNSRGTED